MVCPMSESGTDISAHVRVRQKASQRIGAKLRSSPDCVVMLMAAPHFPIHTPKLAVTVQSAKLALIQSDTQALERNAQGSSVGHRCRQLPEPTRHNPRPAALPPSTLPFKRTLRSQH